jgi:myo-inositol catabolism protein IolC
MPADDLTGLIRYGIAKADSFGITKEQDVVSFTEFIVRFGRTFYADPALTWAGESLHDQKLGASEKIARMKAACDEK